ncbi:hypothetical protein ElyMa_005576700 [Elysia marginata]|uniref:Uncharacterized protein n=1 Tax=Elysia marginata TaxID=1093978 RepID=A0AAV4F282_9GAST|nr:hypothetical protein ElyMa_005576700 [Elysia marginata]
MPENNGNEKAKKKKGGPASPLGSLQTSYQSASALTNKIKEGNSSGYDLGEIKESPLFRYRERAQQEVKDVESSLSPVNDATFSFNA